MTDLEGMTRHLLGAGVDREEIVRRLIDEYSIYKNLPVTTLRILANSVLEECQQSQHLLSNTYSNRSSLLQKLLTIPSSDVSMGEGGVGCRGKGDFLVHSYISKLSETSVKPLISPLSLDDTGAVDLSLNDLDEGSHSIVILSKMEGMHSRLSDFPFLAGFHVTRAALRDIYVKGGSPISIMVDVHLADDGDIGKLFDFQAGIATIAELCSVPITAGSTLRIGGDMVIGDRLTGGIAAVGIMQHSFFRKQIQEGDMILMSEGAGGGTISTTALYSNKPETLLETMNIKFLEACKLLFTHPEICKGIHSMTDVTNGGLRGDLYEIAGECGYGCRINIETVKELVNPKVLALLEQTQVDFLGVSLDALLIFCTAEAEQRIKDLFHSIDFNIRTIGVITPDKQIKFTTQTGEENVVPRYRESAYTKVKQIVDQIQVDPSLAQNKIRAAFNSAKEKKEAIIDFLKTSE